MVSGDSATESLSSFLVESELPKRFLKLLKGWKKNWKNDCWRFDFSSSVIWCWVHVEMLVTRFLNVEDDPCTGLVLEMSLVTYLLIKLSLSWDMAGHFAFISWKEWPAKSLSSPVVRFRGSRNWGMWLEKIFSSGSSFALPLNKWKSGTN